jgi:hypothetical protein
MAPGSGPQQAWWGGDRGLLDEGVAAMGAYLVDLGGATTWVGVSLVQDSARARVVDDAAAVFGDRRSGSGSRRLGRGGDF